MAVIHILSAGAAQSVAEKAAERFRNETGCDVQAAFGAMGAMKARVVAGGPVDVIVLSAALIEELIASGHVAAGSRRDLGTVGTGVAVRAGTPLPDVADSPSPRGSLLAAERLLCPDPAVATAGKVVMRALELLGIIDDMRSRLQFFPDGYAAMRELASASRPLEVGITQTTEILANKGVTYVGPLPAELQMKTVYCAGVAASARNPGRAREFIARLTAPEERATLEAAGYEFSNQVDFSHGNTRKVQSKTPHISKAKDTKPRRKARNGTTS
jgi:molybdate transport system substrate-binding protein